MLMPPLIFRQITFQSFTLTPEVIKLFTHDGPLSSDRITRREEKALVKWLVNEVSARMLLLEVLSRSQDALYKVEVQDPFYGATEGDIDLLLCNPGAPHEAVALECKRVKVEVEDNGNDRINRLEDVGEGVKQAKKLYQTFSFFQTYLTVISAIDAARRTNVNILYNGITSQSIPNWDGSTTTFRNIVQFPHREELPPEIGIIFIEVVQPSGQRFEEQGTLRIGVHHPATPRPQRPEDTRRIEALMRGTA